MVKEAPYTAEEKQYIDKLDKFILELAVDKWISFDNTKFPELAAEIVWMYMHLEVFKDQGITVEIDKWNRKFRKVNHEK